MSDEDGKYGESLTNAVSKATSGISMGGGASGPSSPSPGGRGRYQAMSTAHSAADHSHTTSTSTAPVAVAADAAAHNNNKNAQAENNQLTAALADNRPLPSQQRIPAAHNMQAQMRPMQPGGFG